MAEKNINVTFTSDTEGLKKGSKQAKSELEKIKKTVENVAKAYAFKEIAQGIAKIITETGKYADELFDLADATGMSAKAIQEWQWVAKSAGVDTNTVTTAVEGLTQKLARGGESSPLNRALEELGVYARDASGQLRNGGEVANEVINRLADLENVTDRNVKGAQIFGGAWKELAPILALGKDAIQDLKTEANELGVVMSEDDLKAANDFRVETEKLSTRIGVDLKRAVVAILPVLGNMYDSLRGAYYQARDLFKFFGSEENENLEAMQKAKTRTDEWVKSLGDLNGEEELKLKLLEKQRALYTRIKEIEKQIKTDPELLKGFSGYAKANDLLKEQKAAYAQLVYINQSFNGLLGDGLKIIQERQMTEAEMAEAAKKALAEEQRLAAIAEAERLKNLGDIGRLREKIANEEASYIASNSEKDRVAHLLKKAYLEKELELLEQQASAKAAASYIEARGMGGISTTPLMPSLGAKPIPTQSQDIEIRYTVNLDGLDTDQISYATDSIDALADSMRGLADVGNDLAYSMGQAFGSMVQDNHEATKQIIKDMAKQAIAGITKWAMTLYPPPASFAIAAAGGLAAAALIPAMAEGGVVNGPTMALVGEYPNARVNPEVVAPLDKLKSMIGETNQGGLSGDVEFKIKGDSLYGILKRFENRKKYNS